MESPPAHLYIYFINTLLAKLNPVKYNLKADKDNNLHLGFIAEDVPDLVASLDRQTISNDPILALLTKVINEQEKRLLELVEKVEILEKKSALRDLVWFDMGA